MFTGIITDIGTLRARSDKGETLGETRFEIETRCDPAGIAPGASIACSGACMTVVDKGTDNGSNWFAVEVSGESLSRTTLGTWRPGRRLNLERALKAGDELGGHIVSGHVDGVGEITAVEPAGDSKRFQFRVPENLRRFIAEKGSVAVDGVSLTVNNLYTDGFDVNIIPHTQQETTFGTAQVGDKVNLEIDMLARYVARLHEADQQS